MLTQRDVEAGVAAVKKAMPTVFTGVSEVDMHRIAVSVILAVDAERSPVAITKDVLGNLFAPSHHK